MSGGTATALGLSLIYGNFTKLMMTTNINEMADEYAMLKDIKQRKIIKKNETITVKNAVFNERFDNFSCEKTVFVNCVFESGSLIYVKSLVDVKFEKCNFTDSQISGGVWKNVAFRECIANGEFLIFAEKKSEDVRFDKCEFSGPASTSKAIDENTLGAVGSLGSIEFANCKLSRINLRGEISLKVRNSHLTKISAETMREGGKISLEKVTISDYIDFTKGIYSEFCIKDSTFEFMNLEYAKSNKILIDGCSGHLVAKFINSDIVVLKNSTFIANGEKRDPFLNVSSALSLNSSTIGSLSLDRIKFDGVNGTLYLGGNDNIAYDESDRGSKKFDMSKFGKIAIHETPLNKSFLGYVKADELEISNSEIENSNFTNSLFKKIVFSDILLKGTVDFTGSYVDEFSKSNILTKPDLNFKDDINMIVKI